MRKPTKLSHDLDDIRLQDIAYEPTEKEEKAPETKVVSRLQHKVEGVHANIRAQKNGRQFISLTATSRLTAQRAMLDLCVGTINFVREGIFSSGTK